MRRSESSASKAQRRRRASPWARSALTHLLLLDDFRSSCSGIPQRLTLLVRTRLARPLTRVHHFPRQTNLLQCAYEQEYSIELPFAMTMPCGPWVRMVIVVPAFATVRRAPPSYCDFCHRFHMCGSPTNVMQSSPAK